MANFKHKRRYKKREENQEEIFCIKCCKITTNPSKVCNECISKGKDVLKICTKCKRELPLSTSYYRDKDKWGGYKLICKNCYSKYYSNKKEI